MITIISGTNRKNSNSFKISLHYQALLERMGETVRIIDLEKLPVDFLNNALYGRKDKAFEPFLDCMKKSEKYVFVVPEYNGSFPGVMKVFIDALEFPETFKGKKCALVGLSSGVQGAVLAMSHLTDIFNYLGMHVLSLKPKLAGIENRLNVGNLEDELSIQLLEEQANALIRF